MFYKGIVGLLLDFRCVWTAKQIVSPYRYSDTNFIVSIITKAHWDMILEMGMNEAFDVCSVAENNSKDDPDAI